MCRSVCRLWLCGVFGLVWMVCGLPVAAQEIKVEVKKVEVKKAVGRPAPQGVIPAQKLLPAQKEQAEDERAVPRRKHSRDIPAESLLVALLRERPVT